MDFIAAVVAIIAIILVLRMRSRVSALEEHARVIHQRLEAAGGAPLAAEPQTPTPEAPPVIDADTARPRSPLEVFANKAAEAQPPKPAERLGEADIANIIQEASSAAPPPPPQEPETPAKSFEERFGA